MAKKPTTEPTETQDPTMATNATDNTTTPEAVAPTPAGPVTFLALAAPGQAFTFAGSTYLFHQGEFTTDDPDVVAFLDANPNAVRK